MQKKKAPPVVNDINVTPMVDVMLVLLIIFMVITPMLTQGRRPSRRWSPRTPSRCRRPIKKTPFWSRSPSNGQFWLSPGNAQIHIEDLAGKVRDLQTNKLDKTVYIKADARAKYEAVEDVVDNLRAAGVDQIGLITEQMQRR